MMNIADICPYERNPRHNEEAVDAVARSIKEFGFRNPVILDKDHVIVAGHTRVLAAKSLGLADVPCVIAEDLTPEQARAFRIADNKTAEIAEWDYEMLPIELKELQGGGFDMSLLGFIKNDAGGKMECYGEEVFPTLRSQILPAVAQRECFSITPCDANGTRKDRPDGGLYVTSADASKTLTHGNPNTETVVVEPPAIALDGDKMGKAERAGGSGLGVNGDDVMYTQTAKDVHGVAYAGRQVGCDLYNGKETGDVSATVMRGSCTGGDSIGPSVIKVDTVVDMMGGKSGCHVSKEDVSPTLATTHGESHAVSYGTSFDVNYGCPVERELAHTQTNGTCPGHHSGVMKEENPGWRATVRRLLPVETERLMGFPDGWTQIPWKGRKAEDCPDAPRYKACGNSMCVNVMRWIGLRIDEEERRIRDGRGEGQGS
jgi:hypothetical protein